MEILNATVRSKGQVVIPAELRKKHGIRPGTKVAFMEDPFGGLMLKPINEEYIDRIAGCLKGGNMLETWLEEHRAEGEKEKY